MLLSLHVLACTVPDVLLHNRVMFYLGIVHSVTHIARYIVENETRFLFGHVSGVTGMLAWLFTFLVVVPMAFARLKKRYASCY